ncbi:MAG: translocase of the inner membrane [Pleopsidium flavum]|nr:MAG: translocase of the inner membrane [Pleopsidium flavum]
MKGYASQAFANVATSMEQDISLDEHFSIMLNGAPAIGGAVWHGVKGFRNSPYGERRIGALTAIKARAPVLGGNFGVWGGLFSTFDCAVKGVRKKEDPYNASTADPEFHQELIQDSSQDFLRGVRWRYEEA